MKSYIFLTAIFMAILANFTQIMAMEEFEEEFVIIQKGNLPDLINAVLISLDNGLSKISEELKPENLTQWILKEVGLTTNAPAALSESDVNQLLKDMRIKVNALMNAMYEMTLDKIPNLDKANPRKSIRSYFENLALKQALATRHHRLKFFETKSMQLYKQVIDSELRKFEKHEHALIENLYKVSPSGKKQALSELRTFQATQEKLLTLSLAVPPRSNLIAQYLLMIQYIHIALDALISTLNTQADEMQKAMRVLSNAGQK